MKIILKEDVENLGEAGEVVEVADGYGRNYLIPQGMAEMATEGKVQQIKERQRAIRKQKAEEREEAEKMAEQLAEETFTISVRAGEQDRLFGSVTTQDIEETLSEAGYEIDRRNVELEDNIKELGEYDVPIKLYKDVKGVVTINVVPEKETEEG